MGLGAYGRKREDGHGPNRGPDESVTQNWGVTELWGIAISVDSNFEYVRG